jgi:DNA-binding MarR family transcriptional regulator
MREDPDEITRLKIALGRISRTVDRLVSGDGLTRTQLSVLGTVARVGPLGIGELAATEGLNPTMLSRVVGKLETDGLLHRTADPADRRAARVEVTDEGRALHCRLRDQRTQLFTDALGRLPGDDADTLMSALPALESLASAIADTGR